MPDRVLDPQELTAELAQLRAEVTRLREEQISHVDRTSRRRDRRLTLAYVLGTALVVGITSVGSASALDGSNTVFSDDIVNGTVASGDLKDGGVGTLDVRNGSLAGVDVADGSISGEDLNLFSDNQCTGETVQGTAGINADPAVPTTYNTNWVGWSHSCSGEPVQVLRQAAGHYKVKFGTSSPSRLAVATSSSPDTCDVGAINLAPGEFKVIVWAHNGDTNLIEGRDCDFSILAY